MRDGQSANEACINKVSTASCKREAAVRASHTFFVLYNMEKVSLIGVTCSLSFIVP